MKTFEFGDKVKYFNREAVFIRDNSAEYGHQSKMALIMFETGDTKNVRFSSIKKQLLGDSILKENGEK